MWSRFGCVYDVTAATIGFAATLLYSCDIFNDYYYYVDKNCKKCKIDFYIEKNLLLPTEILINSQIKKNNTSMSFVLLCSNHTNRVELHHSINCSISKCPYLSLNPDGHMANVPRKSSSRGARK
jgi:hypothetical protein